jgi:hypothetical protein
MIGTVYSSLPQHASCGIRERRILQHVGGHCDAKPRRRVTWGLQQRASVQSQRFVVSLRGIFGVRTVDEHLGLRIQRDGSADRDVTLR